VLRFSGHPENLATEALVYLLQSDVARDAIRRRLTTEAASYPEDLRFRAQVHGEQGEIPDVVGTDADGAAQVVLEAKFWAQLTPNQPVTYLRGVSGVPPRVLAFVVPRLRFETIWPELLRRCAAGSIVVDRITDHGDLRSATTADGVLLAIVSWARLLEDIRVALENAGNNGLAEDARQLEGLAHTMDTTAPLPFHSGFLTSEEPALRYSQLIRLVNEVTERAVADEIASTTGLKATATSNFIGRYMMLGPIAARLAVDLDLWSRFATSPIWLTFFGFDFKGDGRDIRPLLQNVARLAAEPSRTNASQCEAVPLFVPDGTEWHDVVDSVYGQLYDIQACFRDLPPPAVAVQPPPDL